MDKLKDILGNVAAVIYFFAVMSWILILFIFTPMMQILDINVIGSSGFSTADNTVILVFIFGLIFGLSLLIPAFRKIYYKLPWMFPFVKIWFLDIIILGIATMLLNCGYEVQNPARHTLFFIIMICQIIICRAAMCIYFDRKKVLYVGDDGNVQ